MFGLFFAAEELGDEPTSLGRQHRLRLLCIGELPSRMRVAVRFGDAGHGMRLVVSALGIDQQKPLEARQFRRRQFRRLRST